MTPLAETYVELLLAFGIYSATTWQPMVRFVGEQCRVQGRDCLKVRLRDASNILLR